MSSCCNRRLVLHCITVSVNLGLDAIVGGRLLAHIESFPFSCAFAAQSRSDSRLRCAAPLVDSAEGRFDELCTCHRVSPLSPFISRRVYRISSELRSQAASSFLSTGVGDHPGIGGNGDFILFAFRRRSPLLLLVSSLLLLYSRPRRCSSSVLIAGARMSNPPVCDTGWSFVHTLTGLERTPGCVLASGGIATSLHA